jgi:hypothetical protein
VSEVGSEFSEEDFDPTADEQLSEPEHDVSLEEIVHSLARLLPDSQELQWFDAGMPVADALTTLQRAGFRRHQFGKDCDTSESSRTGHSLAR